MKTTPRNPHADNDIHRDPLGKKLGVETVRRLRGWTIGRPRPVPPLGKLKSISVPKEPPSRSLIRASDLRAHAKGAHVGMASSIFGFGTVRAAEELIEVRVRLDSGAIEPVYLTAAVLERAAYKLRTVKSTK